MKTIHSDRYRYLLTSLKEARENAEITQIQLSKQLGKPQSYVSKYENSERRLDIIEFIDICDKIGISPSHILNKILQQ